ALIWDLATGWPLTPPLTSQPHEYPGDLPSFPLPQAPTFPQEVGADGNRWFIDDEVGSLWDLSADDRPAEDLVLLAQLLTGQRLDEADILRDLSPAENCRIWEELRAKYPGAFTVTSGEEMLAWHRRQAHQAEMISPFAAKLHLDFLIRAAPEEGR